MGAPIFPVRYTGDAVTSVFNLGFNYLDPKDVRVFIDGVLKTLGTDYAIQTKDRDSGYDSIRFFSVPAGSAAIKFYRNTSLALRKPTLEISHLVAMQALYRQQEQGEELKALVEVFNATDTAAGTVHTLIAPCDGYIEKLRTEVTEAVGTGGPVTVKVEGVLVTGLSCTIANSAPVGNIVEDTPTTAQSSTTKVRRGQSIQITPDAAFATSGAFKATLFIQPADLD
jgi:hypothetical protein